MNWRLRHGTVVVAVLASLLPGCGGDGAGRVAHHAGPKRSANGAQRPKQKTPVKTVRKTQKRKIGPAAPLWDLLKEGKKQLKKSPGSNLPPPRKLDDALLAAAGFRKLNGKRLTLYTDLPASSAVDELPAVFDAAYPQWCGYFGVEQDPKDRPAWRMQGFLMRDKQKFMDHGLLPDDIPEFDNGYAHVYEFWIMEQPGDYYRRHIMLHEGTHGFMNTRLGGSIAPWYMEATAELMGTHLWDGKALALRHIPRSREETPFHGRIKLLKDACRQGKGLFPRQVFNFGASAHYRTEAYAWCWGAAVLMDGHSQYQPLFRKLFASRTAAAWAELRPKFSDQEWREFNEQWQVFFFGVEYGYDVARNEIKFVPGKPLPEGGGAVTLRADRGWQSSGLKLEKGVEYEISASGRYIIATKPKPWECEPGGVTIRYYRGLPLGGLVAAVRDDDAPPEKATPLLFPRYVGLKNKLTPQHSGTLYFKINDSPAELADNTGELKVTVK